MAVYVTAWRYRVTIPILATCNLMEIPTRAEDDGSEERSAEETASKVDISRLVQPGEWDLLAAEVDLKAFERQMDDEFESMKQELIGDKR
jgi:hypothetical protein